MICLPCKGCGADLGYVMWPWGDPFLPSKPYFRDGAAWCAVCLKGGDAMQPEDPLYNPQPQLPGASVDTADALGL